MAAAPLRHNQQQHQLLYAAAASSESESSKIKTTPTKTNPPDMSVHPTLMPPKQRATK